jgi:hypothetical protein
MVLVGLTRHEQMDTGAQRQLLRPGLQGLRSSKTICHGPQMPHTTPAWLQLHLRVTGGPITVRCIDDTTARHDSTSTECESR